MSTVFGKLGDKLAVDVFVSKVKAAMSHIEKMAALHAAGKNTEPQTNVRDIEEALRLYNYLIKHPVNFKEDVVRGHLAALPISLAARPVMVEKDVAIHLGVNYIYKDYSSLVPKNVADHFKVVPVQVFKKNPEIKSDPWRDPIVVQIKNKGMDISGAEMKAGVYTKCVGVTIVWGGTNTPCPYEDQPRIVDQPRHRCEECTKAFSKARGKMRRSGRVPSGDANVIIKDLLSLLKK